MLAKKDPYIKSAYEQLQRISQDEQKRLEYEAREKAIRDHNQLMFEAKQRGMLEGIELGKQQGMEKGLELGKLDGIIIGKQQGIQALILDHLEEGFSKEKTLIKLQKRFQLTEEEAKQSYDKFAKNNQTKE